MLQRKAAAALPEMVAFLRKPDKSHRWVHREVLNYLRTLGPDAEPALPALKDYIAAEDNDPENVAFAKSIVNRLAKSKQK
jgi:hypothetical protein